MSPLAQELSHNTDCRPRLPFRLAVDVWPVPLVRPLLIALYVQKKHLAPAHQSAQELSKHTWLSGTHSAEKIKATLIWTLPAAPPAQLNTAGQLNKIHINMASSYLTVFSHADWWVPTVLIIRRALSPDKHFYCFLHSLVLFLKRSQICPSVTLFLNIPLDMKALTANFNACRIHRKKEAALWEESSTC